MISYFEHHPRQPQIQNERFRITPRSLRAPSNKFWSQNPTTPSPCEYGTPSRYNPKGMGKSSGVSACAFLTTGWLKYNSGNSLRAISIAQYCSELNCVKACAKWLRKLSPRMALAYDKGIRGMRSLLPNLNFVFMPCFLAPSQGKTQLTVNEAVETRGVARNRYVVEITYKRAKEWHLLREVVIRLGCTRATGAQTGRGAA